MSRDCPRCGRTLPAGHTLCVKCGERLDPSPQEVKERTETVRRVWLVAGAVIIAAVASLAALAVWSASTDDEEPAGSERAPSTNRGPEDPARPLGVPGSGPGRRRAAAPGTPGRARPSSAATRPSPSSPSSPMSPLSRPAPPPGAPPPGRGAPPGAGPRPLRPPMAGPRLPARRFGLVQGIRDCVDRERSAAEARCGGYRSTLGHTAESLCLVGRTAEAYWDCLKREGKGLGRCVIRCAGAARRCALACMSAEGRSRPGGTAGCLWQCWRQDIDPCIGKCIRP